MKIILYFCERLRICYPCGALRLVAVAAILTSILSATAIGAQSSRQARLQELLKKYPDADANKDGTLTAEEALAYKDKMMGKAKSSKNKKTAPSGYSIKPDYADLKYGPHERNAIDLWLAKSKDGSPTPLAIFIHGGGFRGGDKSKISMANVKTLLDSGISAAAINYRLTDVGPFPMQMHDGARAIQFLRYHAKKYDLDKERFACYGGSAGGCMSFWLAFHDDLADPKSKDPVARESTRLTCIAPNAGQSALERNILLDWFQVENLTEHNGMRPLFGIDGLDDLEKPHVKALIKEASPLTHLTKDDPPVFMTYGGPDRDVTETTPPGTWVHHPRFGIRLKEIMDKMKMESHLKYPGAPEIKKYESGIDFIIKKLKK